MEEKRDLVVTKVKGVADSAATLWKDRGEPVAQKLIETGRSAAKEGAALGKAHGEQVAGKIVETGKAVLETRIGKRVATGAVGGGAIASALPFVSILAGAAVGAGIFVLWKGLKDND